MLRLLIVFIAATVGTYYAIQSPFYALLFYLGNAYFRPEDWVWGNFVRSLDLSYVIGVFVLGYTILSRQRLVWNGRITLLWSFLMLSLLSSLLSEHSAYSWPYVVQFIKVIVITYLIVVLTTNFTKFRLVVITIVLALGLEQAKQGWFYLLTSPGGANNNPVAFLGDNNGTAIGMLMLVPLVGLLMQTTHKKSAKTAYGLILVGSLYRALSTYSRGGFLAAVVMGGMWWLRSQQKLRNLLGMLVILGILLPALPDAFWDRMDTIQTYEEVQDESALGRFHFWSVAVDMAAANPALGIGFNSYNEAYDAYDPSEGRYGFKRSVHSSFFGILAELGYVGIFLYVLILWGAFRNCAQVERVVSENEALLNFRRSAVALQASLVAFVVGGMFLPMQYSEMLWHVIGLSIVLTRLTVQQQERIHSAEPIIAGQPSSLRDSFAA
jgi:putative inorganic carbon (hco3(-)) transporter